MENKESTVPVSPPPNSAPAMAAPKRQIPRPSPPLKSITSEFAGPETNPTLVEFQSRNSTLPDWRLQLQNSVRQRRENFQRSSEENFAPQTRLVTSGANALKAEIVEEPAPQPAGEHINPKVANALKRINESRKAFLPDNPKESQSRAKSAVAKNYPFNVVTRNAQPTTPARGSSKPALAEPPKPKLVPTFKIEKRAYDTNKLPPLRSEPQTIEDVEKSAPAIDDDRPTIAAAQPQISIRANRADEPGLNLADGGEIEDLAPISMRFNAGLFDLIIGAFASFALLSPLVLIGGNWFSVAGVTAFAAVWAMVMFVYLTIAVGMYGKTVGMRMFALELIDADENDYPTFRQAAVHSAIYLLTLPLLGAGFIPLVFNQEQRAAHDLAAGTIIVTEF